MIETVTVFFRTDGKPCHVFAEGQSGPLDYQRFACGLLRPEWWEPSPRHRCKLEKLKPLLCPQCQEYAAAARVAHTNPRPGKNHTYVPRVRKSRASTGRKPGKPLQS